MCSYLYIELYIYILIASKQKCIHNCKAYNQGINEKDKKQ